MPPRIDRVNNNQETFKPIKPKVEPPRVEPPRVEPQALNTTDKNLFLRQNSLGGDMLKISLFSRFNQTDVPALVPTQQLNLVDPDKVEDAVENIKDKLNESFFGDVSHGDLESIQNTFEGLNSEEANEVFRQLSDDDLKKWADELDGALGSFDTEEKKTLFDDLAGKLDGQQLARLTNALGDDENIQSLSDSVANNASDATIADLINRNQGAVENSEGRAVAVAELIAGLGDNPQMLESALQDFTQTQLAAVVQAASQEEIHTSFDGSSVYTTFDPAPLVDMLNAVSRTGNAELKANVFQAASLEMKRIEEAGGLLNQVPGRDDAVADVRAALTGLLASDTTGIMTELEHNFRNGDGVTAYVKSMLDAGETTELGNIIARLSKGNGLTGDPLTRFGAQVPGTDGNPHYQNAQVLGYFAGALFAGANQITSDRSEQADMLKNVFGTIAGVTGAANPAAGAVSSVLNGLTQAIVTEVTDGLNQGTMDMAEALEQLLFPRDTQTGDTYEGAAEADYDSAFSRVILRNP